MERIIQYKINKYAQYIDNLQWHLDNNTVPEANSSIIEARIKAYKEVVDDLRELIKLASEAQ